MNTAITVTEPAILTANTYFWTTAPNASSRRRNETRRQAEIADWFKSLGMTVMQTGNNVIGEVVTETGEKICATFHYAESCKNIYKSLAVTRTTPKGETKNSNITAIRKLMH